MAHSKNLAQALLKISQLKDNDTSIEKFFDYLKENGFLSLLPQIKKHFLRELKQLSEKKTLVIYSKHQLSQEDISKIISLVGAPDGVPIRHIIQGDIIGGFSASYMGNVYDGSLQNQITQLKSRLLTSK